MAEQMTNRARLESETYTKLHEVMKQKSGGSADSIYPKLKAFSRFAQDMVTDVRGPAQSHMSSEFVKAKRHNPQKKNGLKNSRNVAASK